MMREEGDVELIDRETLTTNNAFAIRITCVCPNLLDTTVN